MHGNEYRERLFSRFLQYKKYGKSLDKAIDVACSKGVKKHVFFPSGRFIYTVVGSEKDEFIDPERNFCSCRHYFFKILTRGDKNDICYHLLGYLIAKEIDNIDTVTFSDDEYNGFLRAIITDLLSQ